MGWVLLLSSVFFITLIPESLGDPRDFCPTPDLVAPCFCDNDWPDHHAIVKCGWLTGNDFLMDIFNKTSDYGYENILVSTCSFMFIPASAFQIKKISHLFIVDATMVSLFDEPPNSKDLEEISLTAVTLSRAVQWELFSGMPNLKNLTIYNTPSGKIGEEFVQYVPKSLERFYFSNGSISKLPDNAFQAMTNLTHIYMDSDNIKELKRTMFPTPALIKEFGFTNQKITSLPEDIFKDMPHLLSIWLQGNLISQISENTFRGLFEMTIIECILTDNPIKCNCSIRWFGSLDRTHRRRVVGHCEDPKNMSGFSLVELQPAYFKHCADT